MRKVFLSVAVLGLLLGGCSRESSDPGKRVVVYMYSEYIDPAMIKEFEKQTGLKLRIDVYENTEEMQAKLGAGGGAAQYDVIVLSDMAVPGLIKQGIVQPIDRSKVPNAANVDARFANPPFDPGSRYSLPYQWGTVGIMYQTEKVKSPEISWAMIFDPSQQPGPFILMDSMRDMLGIALKYQGKSMNTRDAAEIDAAAKLVLAAKKSPNCLGFEGGVGGKNRVMAGTAAAAVVYNGDAVKAIVENKDAKVAFVVPKEGGVIWTDVMMVSAKAPNPGGAHQFINYILDARAGAQLSNFNRYPTPNAAAMPMILEEDRKNPAIYPGEEVVRKLEYLHDVDKDTKLYDAAWTAVKAK